MGKRENKQNRHSPLPHGACKPWVLPAPIQGTRGHPSSESASLVAQSSEGPAGVHESTWQACTCNGMPTILGWPGSARVGVAGGWGCQLGGRGARLGAAVSLLSRCLGVESAFSKLVSFVTSPLSRGGHVLSRCPSRAPWGESLLPLPTTPAHQLHLLGPGSGVVWKVEICVGTLPLWGLWFLRLLPRSLLALHFPQLVHRK